MKGVVNDNGEKLCFTAAFTLYPYGSASVLTKLSLKSLLISDTYDTKLIFSEW